MLHRLALVSSILSCATACGVLERWACGEPCEGGVRPAEGSEESFTLADLDEPDATVSDAMPCEEIEGERVHVVHVVTRGADTEIDEGEWIADRLRDELSARDLPTGWGLGECTDPTEPEHQGLRVFTTDWADTDPIVETILELAKEDDVALELTIAIEPVVISCPDEDCGA